MLVLADLLGVGAIGPVVVVAAPAGETHSTSPPRAAALVYDTDIRPAVVNFDWTGKPPAVVQEPTAGTSDEVEVRLTPVSDVLEVLMVLVDELDPGESLCLVRMADATANPRDRWLAIGSTASSPDGAVAWQRSSLGRELQFVISHTVHHAAMIAVSCRARGLPTAEPLGVAAATLRHRRDSADAS